MVDIPETLKSAIYEGRALLFLGAGASIGAKHPRGLVVPSADALRDELCDEFLAGKLKNRTLANIADLVRSERSLGELQRFVRDRFRDFRPADFHKLITKFPWQAILSTNYDTLVEAAYEETNERVRDIEVCVKDLDKIDVRLGQNTKAIPFFKLHGCIQHYQDHSIPLILSSEQYARYRTNRNHMFNRMADLARQFPVTFCGYSLQDPNIQQILFDLADANIDRPRYFLVDPGLTEFDENYWGKNRFTCVKVTFEEFLHSLARQREGWKLKIPTVAATTSTSLSRFFRLSDARESERLEQVLEQDVEHLHPSYTSSSCDPKRFYHGFDVGWGSIEQELDAARRVVEDVLDDAILTDDTDDKKRKRVEVLLLKGPAGNGKSVALRRLAWNAGVVLGRLALFLRENGALDYAALEEIYDLTKQRIYLFVDRAALRADELVALVHRANKGSLHLTLILAERDNEWNVYCDGLDRFVHEVYPVNYLSEREVEGLLDKLEEHKALGALAQKSRDEQRSAFLVRAERQLLVALHEATLGRPFEDILFDEYSRLVPDEAKQLYLDVCTLNRLGVPVRAGLIARTGGIAFSEFEKRFLRPLEHVVKWSKSKRDADAHYTARHSHVAAVVFDRVLSDREDRFTQLVRVLNAMNLSYASDFQAFGKLVKASSVKKALETSQLGRAFYERAREFAPEDTHLLHQFAVFELREGNLEACNQYTREAIERAPHDRSILHTAANLRRRQAKVSKSRLEKKQLRDASRKFLSACRQGGDGSSYDVHLDVSLIVDELEELLDSPENEISASQSAVTMSVEATRALSDAMRRHPDSSELLMLEHRLRTLTGDNALAERALQKAFAANPRQEYVAVLLARTLEDKQMLTDAIAVLEKCLENKEDARDARFLLARMLLSADGRNDELALQHLQKSFVRGDGNAAARLFYARELILRERATDTDDLFAELRQIAVPPKLASRVQYVAVTRANKPRVFDGVVTAYPRGAFCFIRCEELRCSVFCHETALVSKPLSALSPGDKVRFHFGVSMRGAAAARAWLPGTDSELPEDVEGPPDSVLSTTGSVFPTRDEPSN